MRPQDLFSPKAQSHVQHGLKNHQYNLIYCLNMYTLIQVGKLSPWGEDHQSNYSHKKCSFWKEFEMKMQNLSSYHGKNYFGTYLGKSAFKSLCLFYMLASFSREILMLILHVSHLFKGKHLKMFPINEGKQHDESLM